MSTAHTGLQRYTDTDRATAVSYTECNRERARTWLGCRVSVQSAELYSVDKIAQLIAQTVNLRETTQRELRLLTSAVITSAGIDLVEKLESFNRFAQIADHQRI